MSKSVSKEIYIRKEEFLNSNPVKYQDKSKKCDKGRIFGGDEGKTLFRLCCHTRQQKPSQSAFRTFSVSGYLPQCADCRTRTDRPVRSPAILSPAHNSAVDGELSLPGQSVGMAMMCFQSQPSGEYGETDDTGRYPAHLKSWPSGCTRSQSVYR